MKLKTALMGAAMSLALIPAAQAERGADGNVNVMFWQAVSIMNPYLSVGTKDVEAAALVIEPLARIDEKGTLVPWLVDEIPTLENGGIAEDLKSVTWKLKPGVQWSDGTPLTADDVVFTWQYCTHAEIGCSRLAMFEGVSTVEAVDAQTVRVNFTEAKPNPYLPFVSSQSPVLQKAQFADCLGTRAQQCTQQNFNPIGTGPFRVVEFKTNDMVTLEANPNYRDPAKPSFATVTLKGGGDAEGAARSVLETGEYDYAWNLQLAPEVIANMEAAGKGKAEIAFGAQVERIEVNLTDPSPSLPEGERSTVKHPHPFMTDANVRKALSMAIDRALLAEIGYGEAARPVCDAVPGPEFYAAKNTGCLTQDIEGANKVLDDAGWVRGGGGIRAKDGVRLSLLFQASTNAVRQDFQALIKQWWEEIGVATELKNTAAAVFFGGDPSSPDTLQKFYADVQMFSNSLDGIDPEAYLAAFTCAKIVSPESQWQGENVIRVCDPAYDAMVAELSRTAEPEKRREIAIKLNNFLSVDNNYFIPLVDRGRVSAHANSLEGVIVNGWDSEMWNVADWRRAK